MVEQVKASAQMVGANLSGLYLEEATTDVSTDVSTVFDGTAYFDALEISG